MRAALRRRLRLAALTDALAVLDGDMVIYVAQVPSPHSMRTNNEVGRRVTMHNTAVGKAVLAELDDARILKHVTQAGLTPATQWSVTSLSGVFAAVEQVRASGVATDEQEHEVGVCGMAVAVPGAPTPMAVGISGPVARFDDGLRARAVGALRTAAETVSEALIGSRES